MEREMLLSSINVAGIFRLFLPTWANGVLVQMSSSGVHLGFMMDSGKGLLLSRFRRQAGVP
jgi:hypothetical protein